MQCIQPNEIGENIVPCGVCVPCRKRYAASWCMRIKEEERNSITAYFITLTYADEFLPRTPEGIGTLKRKDYQDFMKRLRSWNDRKEDWEYKVRHFSCGEYGSEEHTFRPHWHGMIFNAHPEFPAHLPNLWKYGIVTCTPFTEGRVVYITNYQLKKDGYPGTAVPPFNMMSKKPPLGETYIERMAHWHTFHEAFYVPDGKFKRPMPRRWKEQIFSDSEIDDYQEEIGQEMSKKAQEHYDDLEKRGIDQRRYREAQVNDWLKRQNKLLNKNRKL